MARLRLLKVLCQAVWIIDDDETIVETSTEAVSVPAVEWPTYATGRFAEGAARLRQQVEEAVLSDETDST